ncbi:MAG: anti-anti-sigma factor [Planctomycetaceae bacterium]|nr:anti-anti-sigma factor [Planctomycetaceae bacterium]
MNPESAGLRVDDVNGITRVGFVEQNILDEANIQEIGDALGALIDSMEAPKVLISFAGVAHLSSAALGALITVNNRVGSKNGELRLADIDPKILEIFKITRLDRLFEIHGTSAEATATFS